MNNFKYFLLVLLGFILILTSCRNDEDFNIDTPTGPDGQTDVVGRVIDENGNALANTTLNVDTRTTVSDENGFFYFNNLDFSQNGNVIVAIRSDRFTVSKIISQNPSGRSEVTIQLLEKVFVGNVNSANGGSVTFEGATVEFPPLAFTIDGGGSFGGDEVNIFAKVVNPANVEDITAIPGDLSAIDASDETVQLASFSMITLEIESTQGQKLNLQEDKEATVTFPVDADVLAQDAPVNIPLWHFDIDQGIWIEEGKAELVNGSYVGNVSHFSWWNCDAPFPVVKLDVTIVDADGNPIPSAIVLIKVVESGITSYGLTNTQGYISGKVPHDQALTISVTSHIACMDYDLTQNIDPIFEETTLPNIVVENHDSRVRNLSGSFIDCEQNPVENAYVILVSATENIIIYPDVNGAFDYDVPVCIEDFQLIAFDFENNTTSNAIEFPDGLSEDFVLNPVTVCEELETFVNVTIGGETFGETGVIASGEIIYIPSVDSSLVDLDIFFVVPLDPNTGSFIEGAQTPERASISVGDGISPNFIYILMCTNGVTSCEGFELNLSSVGPKGDFVIGTFNGTLFEETGNPVEVTGDFRAAHL